MDAQTNTDQPIKQEQTHTHEQRAIEAMDTTADTPVAGEKRAIESDALSQSPVKKIRKGLIAENPNRPEEAVSEEAVFEEATAAEEAPVEEAAADEAHVEEAAADEAHVEEAAAEEATIMDQSLLQMASEDKMPKMSVEEAANFARQLKFDERFAPLDEALANADESIQNLEAARKALKPQAENDERDYMKHVDTMDGLRKQRLSLAERNSELEEKIADAHTKRLNAESKHLANESRMHGYLSQIRKQRETIERLEKERGALEQCMKEQFLREQGGKVLFQSNDPEQDFSI